MNKNENNSSLKQALLDLEKVLMKSSDKSATKILKPLGLLLKVLDENPKYIRETDKIFNQHHYNDKKIHFTKLENVKKLQIEQTLSSNAVKILFYLVRVMSQDNLAAVKVKETCKQLGMSLNPFRNGLEELTYYGCITPMLTQNGIGTIYMINPVIASNCKHDKCCEFEKITPQEQLHRFLEINSCHYGVISSKVYVEDMPVSFNSTELLQEE